MKRINRLFAIGVATSLALGATNACASVEVSASVSIHAEADFYAPLTPHGEWLSVGSYGRCWRPAGLAVEWRPYCYGHWLWTDCGWYWESDEPWAWACYHYGSWVYDPVYFWVWVPAVEWAPAWVSWRVGGGYIGWAPLPPPGVRVTVAAPQFVFVQTHSFTEPLRPSAVVVNNTTIFNQTTVINSIRHETRTVVGTAPQKVAINEGPGTEMVQKATGKPVKAVPVREVVQRTPGMSQGLSPTSEPRAKPSASPQERPQATPRQEPRLKPEQTTLPASKEKFAPVPDRPPREAAPRENSGHFAPPDPKERPAPAPERPAYAPPAKTAPPERPPKPEGEKPEGKGNSPGGEGKGHGKEGESPGKDKP